MNPMQGPRDTGGSSTEVNQADGESIYGTETSLNNMLNPVDNEFPNNSTSSRRAAYTSSSSHAAQDHNWRMFREPSSISGPSDQVNSIGSSHAAQDPNWWMYRESSSISRLSDQVNSNGMRTNHQLPQDGTQHFVGYGSERRQLGLNGVMVHGGTHAGSHIRNRHSFLRGSSSNPMPQHVNMSMDMDSDNCSAQTSGVVIGRNSYGSSLGSSTQAAGESSSGPASSFVCSSCKRKAPEEAPSHTFSGENPDRVVQTENDVSHAGLARYGASSSLSLATPSQSSPNVTSQFRQTEQIFGSGGVRAVAASAFHSTRNTDNLSSRPGRRRRLNPRQPQESVAFSISHLADYISSRKGSLQQNLPLNSPFVDPLDVRSSDENQTNIVHLPALTRNIHQFASLNSRDSSSLGVGMPADRLGPQREILRSNTEQRLFNPVQIQSIWTFTRGNPGSSIDSPIVPQAGPSSAIHARQPIPTLHNPSRTSASHRPLPSPFFGLSNESLMPSGSNHSRQRRSGLLLERQNELLHLRNLGRRLVAEGYGRNQIISELCRVRHAMRTSERSPSHGPLPPLLPTGPLGLSNESLISNRSRQQLLRERLNELLHLRHLARRLAAEGNGRNQIISELRRAVHAMRRGENLPAEDNMVFDPLNFEGMTDRHREMRLDIDNMSHEELLALEERMGVVNSGLSEEVILKAMKQFILISSSDELQQDIEPCCICQEEYGECDDVGTLECGHEFHKECIKQWLMVKNVCPICKAEAVTK